MDQALTQENGLRWANAILTASDKYEGMVLMWRRDCIKLRATHGMLKELRDRFNALRISKAEGLTMQGEKNARDAGRVEA